MLTHSRIADTRRGVLCTWKHVGGLLYLVPQRDRLTIEDRGMNDTGLYIGELITTAWTVDRELSTRTRNGKDPDGQLRNSYTKVDR